ncbi:hypothetical protein FGK60_25935 [Streptomyces sp. DASNCL29]|nr:hypothetical protein FGK60_25935 [Streptomyces sp. DASNCL29]
MWPRSAEARSAPGPDHAPGRALGRARGRAAAPVAPAAGCPLPAPSHNRGSAPDPGPQSPDGLVSPRPPRTPVLNRRRGWFHPVRPGPWSSSAGGAGFTPSVPDPGPQAPEGLVSPRPSRTPVLNCRRG